MIVFGTKTTRKLLGSGVFRCPQCGPGARFEKRRARRWGHLLWIPIIPMETGAPYVECRRCRSTFVGRILERGRDEAQVRAEFERAAGLVMAKMVLADGRVEESEKASLRSILERITESSVEPEFIDILIAKARSDARSAEEIAARFAGSLNADGADIVVRASLMIALSDGQLADEEARLLRGIATALGMSEAHYKGVLAKVMSGPGDLARPVMN